MEGTLILTGRLAAESENLLDLADHLARNGTRVGLLFVGDGVYSLVEGSESQMALELREPSIQVFGCLQDIQARGVGGKLAKTAKRVDYAEIVGLMMSDFAKVLSYF